MSDPIRTAVGLFAVVGALEACDGPPNKRAPHVSPSDSGAAGELSSAPEGGGASGGETTQGGMPAALVAGAAGEAEGGASAAQGGVGPESGGGKGSLACGELTFADPNLDAAVRNAVGSPEGAFTAEDVEQLTTLNAGSWEISSLEGIQCWTNLEWLGLAANAVSELSPLVELPRLAYLDLSSTQVTDFSALLAVPSLRTLFLNDNVIADFTPLSGMTGLTNLHLYGTGISDLSPLTGLTNLIWVDMGLNDIVSLAPLVANPGIDSQDNVFANANPFDCADEAANIATLQARGVILLTDCQ